MYDINNMADVDGKIVMPPSKDFDDQADMCEMIRTLIVHGRFPGYTAEISELNFDFLD